MRAPTHKLLAEGILLEGSESEFSEESHIKHEENHGKKDKFRAMKAAFAALAVSAMLVPLSLYCDWSLVCLVFWWIIWSVLGITLLVLDIKYFAEKNKPDFKRLDHLMGAVVLAMNLALVGFWLLSCGSAAFGDSLEVDVSPDKMISLYREDVSGMMVFLPGAAGGYVQTQPALSLGQKYDLSVPCHGYYVPQTCCDGNNGGCRDCGHWEYPDLCPAFTVVTMAPYWATTGEANGDPAGAHPRAFVFQHRTFVFNTGTPPTELQVDQQAFIAEEFMTAHCRDNTLCAVDLRHGFTERAWSSLKGSPSGNAGGGRLDYSTPSKEEVLERAGQVAVLAKQHFGMQNVEGVPLLWMPRENSAMFNEYEEHIEYSFLCARFAIGILAISMVALVILSLASCVVSD